MNSSLIGTFPRHLFDLIEHSSLAHLQKQSAQRPYVVLARNLATFSVALGRAVSRNTGNLPIWNIGSASLSMELSQIKVRDHQNASRLLVRFIEGNVVGLDCLYVGRSGLGTLSSV